MEVVSGDKWTIGAKSRAKLQSNRHQQTNTKSFLQAGCPSHRPTNNVKALKGKNITSHGLAYAKLTWGLPTLSLTTNSSWLPWGRVAMALISPLMPVPHEIHTDYLHLPPPAYETSFFTGQFCTQPTMPSYWKHLHLEIIKLTNCQLKIYTCIYTSWVAKLTRSSRRLLPRSRTRSFVRDEKDEGNVLSRLSRSSMFSRLDRLAHQRSQILLIINTIHSKVLRDDAQFFWHS